MTRSFADEVRAHLPPALHLPDEFAAVFDWVEAQGQRDVFRRGDPAEFGSHYMSIYPPDQMDAPGASHVIFNFELGPPIHRPTEAMLARIATVAKISGDGGRMGFWCDEGGRQWVVVFNHGWPHVLTDDPVAALQFLGLGYPEPACLEDATLSPEEETDYPGAPPILLPQAYRDFLTTRFGRPMPRTAAELGITIPAPDAPDAIRDWMEARVPTAPASAAPGSSPEAPFIITKAMQAVLDGPAIAVLKASFEYVEIET